MRSRERGAVAIIVAILIMVLCGFVAMSLDVGHLLSARGELQNGADAAALAGAKRLNGTNLKGELAGARSDATNYARNHPTDRYQVEPTEVQLGAWVPPARACSAVNGTQVGAPGADGYKFCAITGTSEGDAYNINAVRVVTRRTGTPGGAGGGAVQLAFGAFVGQSGPQEVAAEAIAVTGGPCGEAACDLPFVLRQGCITTPGPPRELECGRTYFIGLRPAPEDTAGITSLNDVQSANGQIACDIIREGGTCSDEGDIINTQDGQDGLTTHCEEICPYGKGPKNVCEEIRFMADTGKGASACDGSVDVGENGLPLWLGQVPIVRYPGETESTCGGEYHYHGGAELITWGTVGVVSARCEPFDKLPPGAQPITEICDREQLRLDPTAKGDFCVAIKLFCNQWDPNATRVGCAWSGTMPAQAVLVR